MTALAGGGPPFNDVLRVVARICRKAAREAEGLRLLLKKLSLKGAYLRSARAGRPGARYFEEMDGELVETGLALRREVLSQYHDKFAGSGYRVLFHLPMGGVGTIWFSDLMECLTHTGILCLGIPRGDGGFREKWERFQPNVFISMDQVEVLRSLDLEYIASYAKDIGCVRLFTPISKHRFPMDGMSREDEWRFRLATAGKTVDAYFSMMEEEFFLEFFPEWVAASFKYLALPNGCNPFIHYPAPGTKDLDFFIATSFGPERLDITWRYMKPLFGKYRGLLAGPGWGFGAGPIPPSDLRSFYSRARIAPNPLAGFLMKHAMEVSERSFSASACGAFVITSPTPVTHRFFSKQELTCVEDEKHFLEAFAYYVDRPNERHTRALGALRRVYKEHTYFHRVDRLVAFLSGFTAGRLST
jgi:hypothetical protein